METIATATAGSAWHKSAMVPPPVRSAEAVRGIN
jgi:hypothetical protein